MSWDSVGKLVVYLAFAHAFVAFGWAFYWQLKYVSALFYERAGQVAAGTSSLEATGLAQTALSNDAHYAQLRSRWGRAIIWVVCAFAFVALAVTVVGSAKN